MIARKASTHVHKFGNTLLREGSNLLSWLRSELLGHIETLFSLLFLDDLFLKLYLLVFNNLDIKYFIYSRIRALRL